MRSTFFGLEISKKALMAQQSALDITGHNIANASTTGYTRQIPTLVPTTPYTINGVTGHKLSFGSGSAISDILRARDSFLDRQYRWELTQQQYWETRETAFKLIEGILNEPAENSLRTDMDNFFTAWGTLAKDPQNSGSKAVVQQRALALADTFHHIDQQLADLHDSVKSDIQSQAEQINSYARQLALLNDQIKKLQVAGASPNDLLDKRDNILDELSKLVNVRVEESQDPNFTDRKVTVLKVIIGEDGATPAQVLVDDGKYNELKVNETVNADGTKTLSIGWKNGGDLQLGDKLGALQSNLDLYNEIIPQYMQELNNLASGLAKAVNAIYENADPSKPQFFVTNDGSTTFTAKNLAIAHDIIDDSRNIKAGKGENQDGSIALEISSLLNGWTKTTEGLDFIKDELSEATSLGEYYGTFVAKLGVMSQTATRMKEGQDVLVNSMYNQREQVSGVSLDEEVTNLIKFQKSYAAAARVTTMMDEMLDIIVNRLGTTR